LPVERLVAGAEVDDRDHQEHDERRAGDAVADPPDEDCQADVPDEQTCPCSPFVGGGFQPGRHQMIDGTVG